MNVMDRTSPVHYIAPSAISIIPNANGSANDLAVYVARGAKIKVYSPKAGIGMVDSSFQEWTLAGKNRRLADSAKPYTIYARLSKTDRNNGYLVFAPMSQYTSGDKAGQWYEAHSHVTTDGLSVRYDDGTTREIVDDPVYWYVRLGVVGIPEAGVRGIEVDTGILGTDEYNANWSLNPDLLPLRVEIKCTSDGDDAGPTPYAYWGKSVILNASLVEGWTGTDIERFDHWEIVRNSGDASADLAWPSSARAADFGSSGIITLSHVRGGSDDFNGAVSAIYTVTAWGWSDESTSSGDSSDSSSLVPMVSASINILAETAEKYDLALSSSIVGYSPKDGTYSPEDGVSVSIRATDQRGDMFNVTRGQYLSAGLSMSYAPVGSESWTPLSIQEGASSSVATAVIATGAFSAQKSLNVRLLSSSGTELAKATVAFVRDGEDSRDREWIFLRSQEPVTFGGVSSDHPLPSLITEGEVNPSGAASGTDTDKNQDGWVPNGWYDEENGVGEVYHYEYASYRDLINGGDSSSSSSDEDSGHWGDFSVPRIWSHYAGDVITYDIVPSVSVINADASGAVSSDGIVVRAYCTEGNSRSGNILPESDYPQEGGYYYAEYSVDGGSWVLCGKYEFHAGQYRYGIAPSVVETATEGIAIRLKHTTDADAILKEIPPIKVVRDGEAAYSVSSNILAVSFNCDANGKSVDTSVREVVLSMFKGADPISFVAEVSSASRCFAWVTGSSLYISTGQAWKNGNAVFYTKKPQSYVAVGDPVYNETGQRVSSVAAVSGSVMQITNITGNYTAQQNMSWQDLSNDGSVVVLITGDGVSRSLTIPVTGSGQGADWYLSKRYADVAKGLITFLEGLKVGGGGVYGIEGTGVGRLLELITREVRGESYTGTDLLGDEGFRVWTDEYGKGHIITDYLTTRIRQIVAELEIKRITFTSGNIYLSAANARFAKVVPITEGGRRTYAEILSAGGEVLTGSDEVLTGDSGQPIAPADTYAYRCYWPATDGERRTSNDWKVGDMAWCKTENLTAPGSFIDPQNRQYRRLVVAVGTELVDGENCHYIDLSAVLNPVIEGTARTGYDANLSGGNDAPMEGDEVAQVGSQTDSERQGVIALNPVSDNPNIAIYAGVKDYNLPSHRVALLSPAEVNICASYFKLSTAVGTGQPTTPLLKPTVDMWWQNGQNLSVTNSIYVDADAESKIASLSQVQGLPVKIQVKLGNVVIPCSEWTSGTVDGKTIRNSSGLPFAGTGIYVQRAYKNTDYATVEWAYGRIPSLVVGGQPIDPVITSRKIVVAIAFTHDNQAYTVEQEIQMTVQVKGATGAAGQDGTSLNVRGEAELHYVSPSYMPSSDGTYLVDEDWNGTSGSWIVVIENQTESFSLATTGYCYKTLNESQGDASQEGHLWQAQSDGWHDIGPINASDAYSVLPDPAAISMEQNPTDNSWPQPKIGIKAMLGKNTRPYEITAVSSMELQVVRTDSNQKVQITGVNQNNGEYYINGTITITVEVDNKEFTVTVSVAMQPVGSWMLTVQNDTLESVSKKYIPFTTDQGGLVTGLGISAFKQSGDGFDFAVWKTVNGTTHTCDAGLSIYITTQAVDNQTVYEGHVEMTGSVHSKNTGTAQQPEYAWELKEDGTGHLAGGNISWDAAGNVTFSGELSAATGTFAGTLQGVSGTFDGELRAVNGKVYLTSSEVQESGANYTWKGLAVENGLGGDLATVGARTSQGDGSSYGRLVLVKRDAQGNAVNDDTVALDAGEGSIRAKAYKIQKYTVASPDADSTVATDVQLVICSNTSDRNLRLTFTPPVGTMIVIKKTTERGWLNVLDQQGNQIGKFDRGSIMCVYTPDGWK